MVVMRADVARESTIVGQQLVDGHLRPDISCQSGRHHAIAVIWNAIAFVADSQRNNPILRGVVRMDAGAFGVLV